MKRDKRFYLSTWRAQLAADPRTEAMTEEAWYSSFLGLAFRLYYAHLISYDELARELR